MESSKRVSWIDIVKGIAILMVVLGHSRLEINFISRICVGAHMPVFFFLGGLTLHKYGRLLQGIFNKLKALICPYIVCSMVYLFVYGLYSYFIKGSMQDFINMFIVSIRFEGYSVLWFLPTLCFSEIILLVLITAKLDNRLIVCICVTIIAMMSIPGGGIQKRVYGGYT